MDDERIDIAILGGGLAGSLLALALQRLRPGLRCVIVEAGERLGGNHVWSWFRRDVSRLDTWLVAPMTARQWPGYDVHFPGHSRRLDSVYHTITSESLDAFVRTQLPEGRLWTGQQVVDAGPQHFVLADGRRFSAGGVIDARGSAGMPGLSGGWQKFAGQMLKLAEPHGLDRPIVMDARVEQLDGYRFVYVLPFSDTEVFVEDTYYSDTATLDLPVLRQRIADYAAARGWRIEAVSREETGALPVIATGKFRHFWQAGDEETARAGTRAALIHPLTGYSLPEAVRFAIHVAGLSDLSGASLARAGYAWSAERWGSGGYYRMLARLLFGAAQPDERYRVLERFYRLPEPLIERFYAGKSTLRDKVRLLAGRPPVPVLRALACLMGRHAPLADLAHAERPA